MLTFPPKPEAEGQSKTNKGPLTSQPLFPMTKQDWCKHKPSQLSSTKQGSIGWLPPILTALPWVSEKLIFFPLWWECDPGTDFSLYPKFRLITRLTARRSLHGGQIGLLYGIYWTRFVCLRAKSICAGLANRAWEGGQFVWEISNVRWERTLRLLCQICKTDHGHITDKHGGHS